MTKYYIKMIIDGRIYVYRENKTFGALYGSLFFGGGYPKIKYYKTFGAAARIAQTVREKYRGICDKITIVETVNEKTA